ncbi:MAG: prenyltransferase/squalene oxidase repeat-containing protein [Planctomycetota bacterium]
MAFDHAGDFNDQLYRALKQSPWWMISIGVHVLLFVISGLMGTESPIAAKATPAAIEMTKAEDLPDVQQPDEPQVDPLVADDIHATEPTIVDTPLQADKPETDINFDHNDVYGNVLDGKGMGDFVGVANNPDIGIGGGQAAGGHGLGSLRTAGSRGKRGRPDSERAVDDALQWLAAHQSPDGAWEAEGFGRWCDRKPATAGPDGAGKATYDVGVSGLALLAFLGAGYTQRSDGPYGDVVRRGLRWMVNTQDAEGCFGARTSGHFVYNHAVASLAVVEAYAMSGSTMLKNPAQKALDFIALARNPYFAWRYGVKPGDNDTSVTGWMMMALKSAKMVTEADVAAGRKPSLQLDADAFDGIKTWIEKMTDPDTGRVGYQQRGSGPARPTELVDRFPADRSEAMTAVGVLARVFLGEDPKSSPAIEKGVRLMAERLPVWDAASGGTDMYYWYYATLALFQVGGPAWKAWDGAMKSAIVGTQRRDGDYCGYKGSWDPIDPWGADGGRVYATAVNAMCLEVYYRYGRVFGTK